MNKKAAPPEGGTQDPNTADADAGKSGTQLVDVEALQRELNQARQEAANYRTQLRSAEQAQMSESEKLSARLSDLESKLTEQTAENARLRVATEYKLGPDDAQLLNTVNPDGMEALAKRLAESNADKARSGMVVPGEGKQPSQSATNPLQEVARQLFKKD